MKERLAQWKTRYQNASPRERNLIKYCSATICCAAIYYGGSVPLDNMIKNSQQLLTKQNETLRWMLEEINTNHIQAKVLKTNNPRSVVEGSASEIHLPLTDIRQDGQSLSFSVARVNVYELKNWLREINFTAGIRLVKLDMTPVDHISDVKAQIVLSWKKGT